MYLLTDIDYLDVTCLLRVIDRFETILHHTYSLQEIQLSLTVTQVPIMRAIQFRVLNILHNHLLIVTNRFHPEHLTPRYLSQYLILHLLPQQRLRISRIKYSNLYYIIGIYISIRCHICDQLVHCPH